MARLNVAMVNTELTRGGAARIAANLTSLINKSDSDCEAILYHCENSIKRDNVVGLKRFFSRQLNAGLMRLGGSFLTADMGVAKEVSRYSRDANILHIHNLHGYYLEIEKLLYSWRERPIIWTWHDMWGATGRCAFSLECEKWKSGCDVCPNKNYYPAAWNDRAKNEYQKKTCIYRKLDNLTIVSPSEWLANIALERGFAREQVKVIPNPIDTSRFDLIDKKEARAKLGLPGDSFICLFIASECDDVRKGYADFCEVCHGKDLFPIAVGTKPKQPNDNVLHLGRIKIDLDLNMYYSASDVMIIPTYADNYPTTIIESLVCGTPVIGYDEGGVGSQLEGMPNSKIVKKGNKQELRRAILDLKEIGSVDNRAISEMAKNRWSQDAIVDKYVQLYFRSLG